MTAFQGKSSVDARRVKCGDRRRAGRACQNAAGDDIPRILGEREREFLDPASIDNAIIVRRAEESGRDGADAGILSGRLTDLVRAQVLQGNAVLGKFPEHGVHGAHGPLMGEHDRARPHGPGGNRPHTLPQTGSAERGYDYA